MGLLLQKVAGVRFGTSQTFVGWPVFTGGQWVSFGDNCCLVSHPLGNPLGLFRPCTFNVIENAVDKADHGAIKIGNDFSASGVCIISRTQVTIGNNVSIGANATILDTDLHALTLQTGHPHRSTIAATAPIFIEDDVWIGANAMILKGARIGKGCVVGANVIVRGNIKAYTVITNGVNQMRPLSIKW